MYAFIPIMEHAADEAREAGQTFVAGIADALANLAWWRMHAEWLDAREWMEGAEAADEAEHEREQEERQSRHESYLDSLVGGNY